MDDITYRIRFRKGDFEVETQGDKEFVENKFEELINQKLEAIPKESKKDTLPETLGEFLDVTGNPRKHTDVVAVYAYWLFKKDGAHSFNVKDIVDCYDRTRRTKPKNPNQIINANVASHLFSEATDKKDGLKAWIITRSGEEAVEKMT